MIGYKRAGVDDGPPRVGLGSRVVVELIDGEGRAERLTVVIVPDDKANLPAGYLGASTPLAAAMIGQQASQAIPYRRGDLVEVRILEVEPFAVRDAPDAAGARRAAIEQAVARSDLQDAVRLALAVTVKWGDWDPSGIAQEDDTANELPE